MTTISRRIHRSPQTVFDALIDPNTYPSWLVGCKAMRAIDEGWPEPGTRFHHRVGVVWPIQLDDYSVCREIDPPERLVLEVRARPVGRARVEFRLEPDDDDTIVHFSEVPIGMARLLGPAVVPVTAVRNGRSLDLLAEFLGRREPGPRSGHT